MRKSMKLGAASTLAAVALVAGSATAASASAGHTADDPYVCGNTEAEADGDVSGDGSVPNCQFGDINIFNTNTNDLESENDNENLNVNDNENGAAAEATSSLDLAVDLGGLLTPPAPGA